MQEKIPSHAKRVFKGLLFDVYQHEQEQFDGTRKTFERLRGPDGVQVIAVVGDKLLLIEDEQPGRAPMTGLPGGRLNEGESALAAAKRELLEETGYASDDWELFAAYNEFPKVDQTFSYFIARNCTLVAQPKPDPDGEHIELRNVTFDGFIAEVTSPSFRAGTFTADMLRARLDPHKLVAFKRRLFGDNA